MATKEQPVETKTASKKLPKQTASLMPESLSSSGLVSTNPDALVPPSKRSKDEALDQLKEMNANLRKMSRDIKLSLVSKDQAKTIASIVKGRETFSTLGDRAAEKTSNLKSMFSARGVANLMGVGLKGSGSFMDNFLSKREAMQQYVKDRMKVDPQYARMVGKDKAKTVFKAQFKEQQSIQRQILKVESEISGLQDRGFSEDQIGRAGLLKKRQELTSKLAAVDTRLKPSRADGVAPTPKKMKPKAPGEPVKSQELSQEEKNDLMLGALEGIQQEIASLNPEERKALESIDKDVLEEIFKSALGELSNINRDQLEELKKIHQPELRADGVKSSSSSKESENEQMKVQQKQASLDELQLQELKNIRDALKASTEKKPESSSGGFLDSIMGSLGSGIMSAIKTLFNPRLILRAVSKVFVPAMIIGSLFNGIVDGVKEYMKTGSIGDALIKGFGGVLDFLTFGLFDAETVKKVVDFVSGSVKKYIVEPVTKFAESVSEVFSEYIAKPIETVVGKVSSFFKEISESFMGFLRNFEIPGFSIGIPGTNISKSFGPWKPFAADASKEVKVAPKPTTPAASVSGKVTDVQVAKTQVEEKRRAESNKPIVVSAPNQTNVSSNTTNVMQIPTRNKDNSYTDYLKARYV